MQSRNAKWFERARAMRKILVVDPGFLGDTVALVPALRDLRRQCPDAELHVLTTPLGEAVLRLAPGCVTRAWAIDLHPARRGLWAQLRVLGALRRQRFDLALNFSGADRSLFLTAASGARTAIAHAAGRAHFWNRWLIRHWIARRDPQLPAAEQRRQVLAACGFPLEPPRYDFQPPPEAEAWAAREFPRPELIHFSINASHALKEWPVEHWGTLARLLLAARPEWVILATATAEPREQARLAALIAAAAGARLRPLTLPLERLAAVLARCRAHVGADSGVLHLAAALGVPTVSFFRAYADARAWMPAGSGHRVLSAACECVNRLDPPCAPAGRPRCLADISPEQALRAVLELEQPPRIHGRDVLP